MMKWVEKWGVAGKAKQGRATVRRKRGGEKGRRWGTTIHFRGK